MSSIKKNYIYLVFYQILNIIVPLLVTPYLSRVIGAEGLGIYSYTNSVAYYFYLFAMLGILNYGNRTIASVRDKQDKLNSTFCELITMQFAWGCVICVVYTIYILHLNINESQYIIYSIIWYAYIISATIDISWFFWGIEQFKITVLRNSIIKIFTLVSVFVFIKKSDDLSVYILLISISSLLGQIVLWTQINKYVSIKKIFLSSISAHIIPNIVLFIPVVAVSIYTIMDKIMLGNMCEMQELGYYDNVQKVMTLPTGIITALGTVMMPRITNLLAKGKENNVLIYIENSMQFTLIFAIAFSLGLAGISPVFSVIFFGYGFEPCINMITLFSVTIIFISWANVIRTQYLIPYRLDKIYIISVILGALVNVISNVVLIPYLRGRGAIIGTILAEATVAFVQSIAVCKKLDIVKYLKNGILFLVPGLIMFVIVRVIGMIGKINIYTLFVQLFIGALVYSFITLIILLITKGALSIQIKTFISGIFNKNS